MSETGDLSSLDLESLLEETLRPIEPPERLSGRLEDTLSTLRKAAANEWTDWSRELTDSELQSLRDPRNWVRPVAAAAVGGAAGAGLVLIELRRRRGGEGLRGIAEGLRERLS